MAKTNKRQYKGTSKSGNRCKRTPKQSESACNLHKSKISKQTKPKKSKGSRRRVLKNTFEKAAVISSTIPNNDFISKDDDTVCNQIIALFVSVKQTVKELINL